MKMSEQSIYAGQVVSGFKVPVVDVTNTGLGITYALSNVPGRRSKIVTWNYTFTIAPGAITITLESSIDGVDFMSVDTYNTFGTKTTRTVDVGQAHFVRLNVTALTLGGGTGVGGQIAY